MRKIKFRAWDTKENLMSYGSEKPYMYLTNAQRLIGIGCDLDPSLYHDTTRSFEKEIILMQYTGLKDKNGKEIYEGDVVKYIDSYNTLLKTDIYYTWGGFALRTDENPIYLCEFYSGDESKPTPGIEIIGNIYENP